MQKYITLLILVVSYFIFCIASIKVVEYNYFKDTSIYSITNDNYDTSEVLKIIDEVSELDNTNVYFKRFSSSTKDVYTNRENNPQITSIDFHKISELSNEKYGGYLEVYVDDEGSENFIEDIKNSNLDIEFIKQQPSFFENYWLDYKSNIKLCVLLVFMIIYFNTYFVVRGSKKEIGILILNKQNHAKIFTRIFLLEHEILFITTFIFTVISVIINKYLEFQNLYIVLVPIIILSSILVFQIICYIFTVNISTLDTLNGRQKNTSVIMMLGLVKILVVITLIFSQNSSIHYLNLNKENIKTLESIEMLKDYTIFSITSSSNNGFTELENDNFIEFYEYISLNYDPLIAKGNYISQMDKKDMYDLCTINCEISINENYFDFVDVYDENGNIITSDSKTDTIKIYYSSSNIQNKDLYKNYEDFFGLKFEYIKIKDGQDLPYVDSTGNQFSLIGSQSPILMEYPAEISENSNLISTNIISILTGSDFMIDTSPSEVEKISKNLGTGENIIQINTIESTYLVEKENYEFKIKKSIIFMFISIILYVLVTIFLMLELFEIYKYSIVIKYLISKSYMKSFIKLICITIFPLLIAGFVVMYRFGSVTNFVLLLSLMLIDISILMGYAKILINKGINILKGDV